MAYGKLFLLLLKELQEHRGSLDSHISQLCVMFVTILQQSFSTHKFVKSIALLKSQQPKFTRPLSVNDGGDLCADCGLTLTLAPVWSPVC